ncbi:MAG: hypothetical protein R2778_05390 [Saprospiraceae bacterium]
MRNRLTLLALFFAITAQAQLSKGGKPISFAAENQSLFEGNSIPVLSIPSVDREALLKEDSKMQGQSRFAAPVPVDISIQDQGFWTTMPNGDKLWQLGVQSSGAFGLCFIFDQFVLPEGANFFAYSPNHQHVLGAYTAESCLPSGKFLIGIVPGETAYLECLIPADKVEQTRVHINRVDAAYDHVSMHYGPDDFGESMPCHVNINCSVGSDWQVVKKGVARIMVVFPAGTGWCSGTLIANTSGSYEPYFLTANHCQLLANNPQFDLWRFDFNFESPDCNNPGNEPVPKSVLGCQRISYRPETDFMLLKLNPIPSSYDVYFNGWNRDNNTTTLWPNNVMIHHPNGDIKKITVDSQAVTIYNFAINWNIGGTTPASSHWKLRPELGVQEPGSSGSPLFDNEKRIRGQLHGGNVNGCTINDMYFGRFNMSWDQGSSSDSRLKEWLDPGATNSITQNGYARPVVVGFDISGTIKTHWDIPMKGVKVQLSDNIGNSQATFTDTTGYYIFENITGGANYTLLPSKDTNDLNGITTFDLFLISKNILGLEPLDSPWKMIAADINKSSTVTTSDIVEARKLLLGIYSKLPVNTSWRFFPEFTQFADPSNPFMGPLPPNNISINNLQADYPNANFRGVKIGDTNNTADPNQ